MRLSSATIAHAYVLLMLQLTAGPGQHRLHFSVQTKSHRTPPSVRYDWQNGCLFGMSFAHRDAIKAEAWVSAAITAGYQSLYSFRRRGSGYCPNEVRELLEAA